MNKAKYIFCKHNSIVPVDENEVFVISPKARFCIKGKDMAQVIKNVMSHFKELTQPEDIISKYSDKYSESSLWRLFFMMVEKDLLISESDYVAVSQIEHTLLDKAFFYSSKNMSIHDITTKLSQLTIGLIGTSQLVMCLIDSFVKCGLFLNFRIGFTDSEDSAEVLMSDMNVTTFTLNYANHENIKAAISSCDLVVVACNYDNHYLLKQINIVCLGENKTWVRVVSEGYNFEVGPIFIPLETGCYMCMHKRLLQNLSKEEQVQVNLLNKHQMNEQIKSDLFKCNSLYLTNAISANIAASEAVKYLIGTHCTIFNQVLSVNCLDFKTNTSFIYKDFKCESCRKR